MQAVWLAANAMMEQFYYKIGVVSQIIPLFLKELMIGVLVARLLQTGVGGEKK